MVGIYRIINKINGKSYIGQSIDIQRRIYDHRCEGHEHNRHLRYAMEKYGKDNFIYEVLIECFPEELDYYEKKYIEELKPEYNFNAGGQGLGRHLCEETKKILQEKGRTQWEQMTDEEKLNRINNNLKRPPIGHPVSEETREKLRQANLGKEQSEETKRKRRETIAEKKRNGWTQTNEGHRKKVYCYETDTVYESVKACGEVLGIPTTNISSVLRGRYMTAYNKHFCYAEERSNNGSF